MKISAAASPLITTGNENAVRTKFSENSSPKDSFVQAKRPGWLPYNRNGIDNSYNNAVMRSFKAARTELGISDEDLSAGRYSEYALRTCFYRHLSLIT